jgi:hypothetical protein
MVSLYFSVPEEGSDSRGFLKAGMGSCWIHALRGKSGDGRTHLQPAQANDDNFGGSYGTQSLDRLGPTGVRLHEQIGRIQDIKQLLVCLMKVHMKLDSL